MLPSVAGAICLLLFAALLVVDLVAGTRSPFLLWVAACSLVAVPAAFLAGLLRSRLAKGELADLFGRLPTMPPDQLQTALGRVLGDPGLVIAFPRADGRSYVDAEGRSVSSSPGDPGGAGRREIDRIRGQRRGAGGSAGLRPFPGRRSGTRRGSRRRRHHRPGESAAACRGVGETGRTAVLQGTDHHRVGCRATPDRTQSA